MLFRSIRIRPNPLDAEPTDDYGYIVDTFEYPATSFPANNILSIDTSNYTTDSANVTVDAD